MGGRGGSGTRNTAEPVKDISDRISDFFDELKTREYGSNKPGMKISDERAKEFRRVYADMINTVQKADNPDQPIIFASGFTYGASNPDKYTHSIQKLNQYQKILQSEVRNTAIDLRMGIIDKDRAELELRALKNIDRMIAQRKKDLRGTLEDFIK